MAHITRIYKVDMPGDDRNGSKISSPEIHSLFGGWDPQNSWFMIIENLTFQWWMISRSAPIVGNPPLIVYRGTPKWGTRPNNHVYRTMMTNLLDFVMHRGIYKYLLIHVAVLQ